MTKNTTLALLLTGTALLALGTRVSAGPPAPKTITWGDRGKAVSVKLGQTFLLKLPANPSTGYAWYFLSGASPWKPVGRKYAGHPAKPGMTGVGGDETFTLKATDVGAGYLRLYYIRPFEEKIATEALWQVKVSVEK